MGTSKQEKRLAKGLAKVAAAEAVTASMVADAAASLAEIQPDPVAKEVAAEAAMMTQLAPEQKASGPVLHVRQGLALRGGRGEWYKLLCKYDGQPVAAYIADGKANPASRYTARSTKCGQPKTPESRLSWFKRAGIVSIS